MSQRFRRNIAPVLGALVLLAVGITIWALLGVRRTVEVTETLHAQFAPGRAVSGVALPAEGYAVFRFHAAGRTCATLSLLPDAATLIDADGGSRSAAREQAGTLLAEAGNRATGCDALEVRVFATRMPYHGRFEVRYADDTVTAAGAPIFGE